MATRGTNKNLMWAAVAVAAAVVVLTLYAVFSGEDEEPAKNKGGGASSASPTGKPLPTYGAPEEWTEPERWSSLPSGRERDEQDNEVGFPHTLNGAVAAVAAANSTDARGAQSLVDEQVDLYLSYMVTSDQTSANAKKVKDAAVRTEGKLRSSLGIEGGSGRMPAGSYVRNHVIGYKIIHKSKDEVSAWLLTRVTAKAGEMSKEKASYTRTISAVEWQDGDWKLSAASTVRAAGKAQGEKRPQTAAPGDADFNSAGWTAIREAS